MHILKVILNLYQKLNYLYHYHLQYLLLGDHPSYKREALYAKMFHYSFRNYLKLPLRDDHQSHPLVIPWNLSVAASPVHVVVC